VDELVAGLTNTCCVVVRVVNFTAAGAKYRSVTEEQKGVMQTNISNYQVTHLSNLRSLRLWVTILLQKRPREGAKPRI